MGYMKEIDRRIRQGGDDAIAAACELSDLAKERRGYEDIRDAEGDITDIVTVLRGVGFAAVSPQAGDSASLLHYCVTHAADEIERLRNERRWIPVAERLPETPSGEWEIHGACVLAWSKSNGHDTAWFERDAEHGDRWSWECVSDPSHWMPLHEPPEVK